MARPKRKLGLLLLGTFLVLLVVSHVVRRLQAPPALRPGESSVDVQVVDEDRRLGSSVPLVYWDRPARDANAPVVLLLHGSPGRKEDFSALLPVLTRSYRVVAPDLPGFGRSTAPIPDYSIRAHAAYVRQLLERLGIEQVHAVGFSMGGGVAIELYDQAPRVLRSLTLLSAIGVEELELLGNHQLNHLVHAAQLSGLWLLHEAVPHFGLLDRFPLNPAYARNFYDSDQRPLREVLGGLEPPTLILHGEHDFLVPPEAAREHRRILPHGELQMLDASHFLVFLDGPGIAGRLVEFFDRVESGRAPARRQATAHRRALATEPFDPSARPPVAGFGLLLFMALIAVATLVSEDLTCIAVGLMAGQGRIEFLPGAVACCIGIYVGDLLLFLAGRALGRPALRHPPLAWWLKEEQVQAASDWLSRRGAVVIMLSRFMPGARLPTYFAAGMLRTSLWSFSLYFFVAVVVWTPLLVAAAMWAGSGVVDSFELFQRHTPLALALLGLMILLMVKLVLPLFSYRGRRMLLSSMRRKLRWEFWPPWAVYPPVLLYISWLGLRHKSPLLFTCANPAMVAGGFISESKSEILRDLGSSPEFVARWRSVSAEGHPAERVAQVAAFLAEHDLDYPIVVKPDAGQRGSGVVIVRNEAELLSYFDGADFDALVQEYVAGPEFGVFYYRYPEEPRGKILSITEKRLPVVRGDGQRSVEELILDDPRAVCMAHTYLAQQAHQLQRVPDPGEPVKLVELGTHCRGALFLDGGQVRTEELERSIDRISRGYSGFYFGRYDVRAASVDELQRGRDFKILELNGVTSEVTHIYDPRIGLGQAYSALFEQWRIAFEIARQNRESGAQPTSLRMLIRLLIDYRRSSRRHDHVADASLRHQENQR